VKAGGDPAVATALADAVVDEWQAAPLAEVDRALCDLAAKLTHRQQQVDAQDVEALRRHGLDDRAIHDAVQVIAYFNYITRVADGLGVELEPDAPRYGRAAKSAR
jgi:uncharacterized peroxidase-related enzyme